MAHLWSDQRKGTDRVFLGASWSTALKKELLHWAWNGEQGFLGRQEPRLGVVCRVERAFSAKGNYTKAVTNSETQ